MMPVMNGLQATFILRTWGRTRDRSCRGTEEQMNALEDRSPARAALLLREADRNNVISSSSFPFDPPAVLLIDGP